MDTQRALAAAVESLSGHPVRAWEHLTSSSRSQVARATLNPAGTLIVKTPTSTGPGHMRERAALEVLNALGAPNVPRLLAASDNPTMLLLEDVGAGPSLADHLLSDDPAVAFASVRRWAESVARLQACSLSAGPQFEAALTVLAPAERPVMDSSGESATQAAAALAELMPQLGVEPTAAALDEFVATAVLDEGPRALTPGDVCPDNNVQRGDELVLIDFEWAEYRHVAWEAAYLAVPWPTCWCSWRLPEEVTAAAVAAWQGVLTPVLSREAAAGLPEAVRRATVAWALITTAWSLPRVMSEDDPAPGNPARPQPDRRAVIQNRLAVAVAHTPASTELHRLAAEALRATRERWGARELPVAPAWR